MEEIQRVRSHVEDYFELTKTENQQKVKVSLQIEKVNCAEIIRKCFD